MRITLVNSYSPALSWFFYAQGMATPPYGTCRAGARLAAVGHRVRILDGQGLRLDAATLASRIADDDPEIVVVGAFPELHLHTFMGASAFPFDLELCDEVRRVLPDTRLLVGGYVPGLFPRDSLRLSGAAGQVGKVFDVDPKAATVPDEATTALDGYELLEPGLDSYGVDPTFFLDPSRAAPRLVLPLLGATGCPHRCSFCATPAYFGGRFTERPIEAVLNEMAGGVSRLGVRAWSVWDDTFTVRPGRVAAFCDGIERRALDVRWWCFGQARWVVNHRDLLPRMRDAGCRMVWIGAESVDGGRLDAYRKGIGADEAIAAARALLDAGLLPTASFLFGEPDDDADSLVRRLDASRRFLDAGCVNVYTQLIPVPGTDLFRELVAAGRVAVRDLRLYSGVRAIVDLPGIDRAALEEAFFAAYCESVLSERWAEAFGRANLWEGASAAGGSGSRADIRTLARLELERLQGLEHGPGREVDPCSLAC